MSGIAGIEARAQEPRVESMLAKMAHRGPAGRTVVERNGITLGVTWTAFQGEAGARLLAEGSAADESSNSRYARAEAADGSTTLIRDPLGVAPLYYGTTDGGHFCFASEVKALLEVGADIHEFPPGHRYAGGRFEPYQQLETAAPLGDPPDQVAAELRRRLEQSIALRVEGGEVGSWLSGGLDSSTMAALARPLVDRLPTFAVGLAGAEDLEYARIAADHLDAEHHEILVTIEDLLETLPEVIYHLESFDALLVRSSLVNYLASRRAGDLVPAVLSGEAGDELFAGYDYLRDHPAEDLASELVDITGRLHNTALQRVDRSAAAHGTVPLVGFTDPALVDYALRIPTAYKLRDGVEKWILRRAMADSLPEPILNRRKAKFWSGAGVEDLLATHAEERVSDADFATERDLPNGWRLNGKEELMYYRLFREHFGVLEDLSWMGRTKGAPVAA